MADNARSRNTNTWIIAAIVAFLVLFGIWWFTTTGNVPPEPAPPPADGSAAEPAAPAVPAQ